MNLTTEKPGASFQNLTTEKPGASFQKGIESAVICGASRCAGACRWSGQFNRRRNFMKMVLDLVFSDSSTRVRPAMGVSFQKRGIECDVSA
jgi:hypothetical protein